jgi:hypothetical protein
MAAGMAARSVGRTLVIRFSASLVVVAIGLLVAGVVTSQLALVYLAIAVSVVALIALVIGATLKRDELFGRPPQRALGDVTEQGFTGSREAVPVAAGTAAGPDRERAERVGYGPPPGDEPSYRDDAGASYRDNPAHHDQPAYRDDTGYERTAPDRAGYQESGGHVRELHYSGQGDFAGRNDRARQGGSAGRDDFAGQGGRGAYGWQDDPGRSAKRDRDGGQRGRGDHQRGYEARPLEGWLGERWTIAGTRPGQDSDTAGEPPLSPGEAWPGDAQAGNSGAGEGAVGGVAPSQTQAEEPTETRETLAEEHGGSAKDTAGRGPDSPDPAKAPTASAETDDAGPGGGAGRGESAVETDGAGRGESAVETDGAGRGESAVETDGAGPAEGAGPGESATSAESTASAEQTVTVVPGVPRYHRAECILIRFMGEDDLERMPLEAAKEAGCTPCRACQPDGEAAV